MALITAQVQRLAQHLKTAIPSVSNNKQTKELNMNTHPFPPNSLITPHSYPRTMEIIEVKTSQPLKNWV